MSGLVVARVLTAAGHDVTVFEREAEPGGVWSAARRYPGVTTQDDRTSYAYSDFPMPPDVALHPTGPEVQAYLQAYAARFGLLEAVRTRTEVVRAELDDDGGWRLRTRGPEGERDEHVDHLVAAHGTYSCPYVPAWPGRAAFEAAGGRVVDPFTLGEGAALAGRRVLVVGWGKTACDVAVAATRDAASVTLVARELWWKYPKTLRAGLTFRHLLLTRLGEHLLAAPHRTRAGARLRRVTHVPRRLAIACLVRSVSTLLGLDALGLRPRVDFPRSNSLVTDGFYEAVRAGRLQVLRDTQVVALSGDATGPAAVLADGRLVPADVVVPATGHEQQLAFLGAREQEQLLEPTGELLLHRQVLAPRLPQLSFVGWSQTYRSPLTAEVQALWLAGHLAGLVALPGVEDLREQASAYQLTRARASRAGVSQMPVSSIGDLDAQLEDLGLPLPRRTRLRQLVRPMDPAAYAYVLPALVARVRAGPARTPVRL